MGLGGCEVKGHREERKCLFLKSGRELRKTWQHCQNTEFGNQGFVVMAVCSVVLLLPHSL